MPEFEIAPKSDSSPGSRERTDADWSVDHHAQVDSTQRLAGGRPPWSAVVAEEQTAGRGQAARTFASDPGGLYLTAVLPYAGDAFKARGFALAVGWAVRDSLRRVGVRRLRLRWPNDLMVGDRKVGGILVEQGGPDTLLVGVGLNVSNRPWLVDPALKTTAGRLVDAVAGGKLPEHAAMAGLVLGAIRRAHEKFSRMQLAGFVPILNRCWGRPRDVEIDPANGVKLTSLRGRFRGIDATGGIVLETGGGALEVIAAHHVGRLREVR